MHDGMTTRDETKQRLRIRRFVLASAFSLLYLAVLAVFHSQGKVDGATLFRAAAIVVACIGIFYGLFQSRLNLRFPDPSLTSCQVLAAVATMLYVVYRAPDTRLVFAAFFLVALMFGMLRSGGTQLFVVGALSLLGFAVVTSIRFLRHGDASLYREDVLQLVVTAIAFPWLVFIGSRVKRLNEADRRKDNFLATLAHELRNPLAPIRTGIEIMRSKGGEAHATTVLPMMERQLQHLTCLLDDLLDVSRITRGKVTLHLEQVELAGALQAAIEASRPLIERMGHAFTYSMPPEPVWIEADPVRLAQIISNLLNNAAKYTPEGGRITLTAERRGDVVEIRVADNGIGIPRENLGSIFDMFTQVESHAFHAQGGLGIGLALVKGLAALHGGTIEARSDGPGKGSEFRLRLPAGVAVPTPTRSPSRPGEGHAPLKVLIVDDNRDAASSLSTLVSLMGHEVRVAFEGEKALEIAEDFRPRTVLLDLGMPGMDGYEVCRRLRALPWGRSLRIVAVTGWGQEEDRRKSAEAGFDSHLVKPVSPETLVDLLGDLRPG